MAEETVIRVLNQRLHEGDTEQKHIIQRPKLRRAFWVLSWAGVLLILMGSLSSSMFQEFDKQLHFGGYFLLAVLFTLSQQGMYIPLSLCGIFVLSIVIEFAQGFLGRSPEWSDLMSNGYGIVVGATTAMLGKWMFRYFKGEMSDLLSQKRSKHYKKGDKIFSQGDHAKYLYVVLSGEILLYRKENGRRKPLDIVHPGEVFGEMGLITDDVRFAGARASEDSDLFVMSKDELFYSQHEGRVHPSILVVQALAKRLQQSNEREEETKAKLDDLLEKIAYLKKKKEKEARDQNQ